MRHQLISEYYNGDVYLQQLRARVQNLKEMHEDEFLRAERLLEVYANDPIRFIEDFCFIKFTEFDGNPKPFFLFPYQKMILKRWLEMEDSNLDVDCLVDKPRGMGLTWLVTAYFTWRWLFTPNYSTFILSRTETEVDDGTPDPDNSIFGKIRWQLDMLPSWMMPEGFHPKGAKGTATDSTLKLRNPAIKSSITGSSTNANAGRSRRYTAIFIDECFYIDHFQQVNRALQSVSRFKIYVSTTVESIVAKNFMQRCEKAGTYIPLTWKDHPFKDQQWYDELQQKAIDLDDPDLMREAQIDYSVSPKSQYYPQVAESEAMPLEYMPERPTYVSIDIGGRQDKTVFCYWQFDGVYFNLIDAYENNNKPSVWYAPFLNPLVTTKEIEDHLSQLQNREHRDLYNEGQLRTLSRMQERRKPIAYFGEQDHTVKKMPTNQSTADVLLPFGIKIIYNQYAIDHQSRHHATTLLLPRIRFNSDNPQVMKVMDAIANSKYMSTDRTTTENLKPVHGTDGTADRRAAVENFCVNVGRLFKQERKRISDPNTRGFAAKMVARLRV